ncbi:hypothetical protein GCM10027614_03510 [Micromonospora vulcania]
MAANAPTPEASAQPRVNMPPTLTPSRRETSGAKAAARIRNPTGVRAKTQASALTTTPIVAKTNRSYGESSATPPAVRAERLNGASAGRNSLPYTIPRMAWISRTSPSATITGLSGDRWSTKRITARSTTAPSTSPAMIATTKPSQYEPVAAETVYAT